MKKPRILIVDDDPFIRESLRDLLEHEDFDTIEAGDGKTALYLVEREAIDLLLLDLELPRVSGLAVLERIAERRLDLPVVIISGKGNISTAVRTTKLGAFDFIEKPLDAPRTLTTIRNALAQQEERRGVSRLANQAYERYRMIGSSPSMQGIYSLIEKASGSPARVLIVGESGTGKEMVARAIHRLSGRADGPFVAVNCAAIPESLIESELFGHVRGAFTGAHQSRAGRFEEADGGTLFLDEVGDMSLMTQAKVLRAIERGEIQRVGGEGTIPLDFRLISATNKDLYDEVNEGNFREDLYYRLGVLTITVPPLRERPEDIPDLMRHFLSVHSPASAAHVTPAALSVVTGHVWPGNVREMENVIQRLLVLREGDRIDDEAMREVIERPSLSDEGASLDTKGLREARQSWERAYIKKVLIAHAWRIQETADSLEINRSHLWKKMRQLEIEEPGSHGG